MERDASALKVPTRGHPAGAADRSVGVREPARWLSATRTLLVAAFVLLAATAWNARADVPLTNVVQVAAGGSHACAVTGSGGVKCWGRNDSGQLGNGTASDAIAVVDVVGVASGATAVAVGSYHTCAIVNGGVKCWGRNDSGQLGNGTNADALTPVDATGLQSGVTAISAGDTHTCAVVDGGAKCWGGNFGGQLGNGTGVAAPTAVDVTGLASGVTSVAAGYAHTCAVAGGAAKCWGLNVDGVLGNGSNSNSSTPVDVAGLGAGVTALSTTVFHACAIVNGGARCWGNNFNFQLGNGSNVNAATPVSVTGLASGVTAIATGNSHTCAVVSGGAKCWGGNGAGQLGDGTTNGAAGPVNVVGLGVGVTLVSAGWDHTCALFNGAAQCWGWNVSGQVGNNSPVRQLMPVDVSALASGITAMAAGWQHACAVASGAASCWGMNGAGQLGNGTSVNATYPQPVTALGAGVTAMAAGLLHTCALVSGGAKCWGDGFQGQLGNGTSSATPTPTPVNVTGLASGVTRLAAGSFHNCVIVVGGAQCWGWNEHGQVGNGTTAMATTPVAVTGLAAGVTAIAGGVHHSCAVVNGAVKCWGYNGNGELGTGTFGGNATVAAGVTGLASGATAVATGDGHSCAIVNGGVKCWGSNLYGQLGNGTNVNAASPVNVTGLTSGVTMLAAGRFHNCAVVNGGVTCWGDNSSGQLGNGTLVNATTPVAAVGLTSGIQALVGGATHSCAVVNGGTKCWGYGPLGIDIVNYWSMPKAVVLGSPIAVTVAASAVNQTGATLNGVVTSNGSDTAVAFEYGPTTSYGNTAPAVQGPLPAAAQGAQMSATLAGLGCNAPYHYRIVAANAGGTTFGADATFSTVPCSPKVASVTTVSSNAATSVVGTTVTFTATVSGAAPSGTVVFTADGAPIPGCAAALAGTGNARTATCTTGALPVGTLSIVASYGGDAGNLGSASAAFAQQVVAALPVLGTVVANAYGTMSVTGGTLVGNLLTLTSPTATIQLGPVPAGSGGGAQIDFQGLNVGPGNTLTIRSGAAGQFVVLRNVTSTVSAIGGTLQAQGGGGASPPGLYLWSPAGIAVAASGSVVSPVGLTVDALNVPYTVGQNLTNAGRIDGGAGLALFGANIRGGGAFVGDAIGIYTFGSANNPVNGAYFLQNGLQLHPSSGSTVALTIGGYGPAKQVFNLHVNGNATAWMPSAWPAGVTLPPNNAVVMPGGTRASGVPEPAYGGGSMIVQASGSLTLTNIGTNDFVFPGAIVLKAGGSLDINGVVVNQGWTTSGQAFQGIFFESPNIVSPNGLIRVYGNDLNWMNFSTVPQQYVRAFTLKGNPDGSASFAATDTTTPHLNTYSVIQNTAASGGCWLCQINTQPVNMYGP
jgi:filamentous hemagglutinin family protein